MVQKNILYFGFVGRGGHLHSEHNYSCKYVKLLLSITAFTVYLPLLIAN